MYECYAGMHGIGIANHSNGKKIVQTTSQAKSATLHCGCKIIERTKDNGNGKLTPDGGLRWVANKQQYSYSH